MKARKNISGVLARIGSDYSPSRMLCSPTGNIVNLRIVLCKGRSMYSFLSGQQVVYLALHSQPTVGFRIVLSKLRESDLLIAARAELAI